MSHPFGDLVWQHLVRKRGLSQNKLAMGINQDPAVVARMCSGKALTGPQSRERVVQVIEWFHEQGALDYVEEANALLAAADKPGLAPDRPPEAQLLQSLKTMDGYVGTSAARQTQPYPYVSVTVPVHRPQVAPPCPYKGLFAFGEEDAPFFCGREVFTERLVEAVVGEQKPLVAVIGPSGSGKSSVVFAGLVPQLRKADGWLIASFRPSDRPFQALAASLIPLLEPELSETDRLDETNKLAERLRSGDVTLQDTAQRILGKHHEQDEPGTARHLLLVADQFEQVYTLCRDPAERQRFLDTLLAAAASARLKLEHLQRKPALSMVVTMRADFLGQAISYRPMADALQDADLKLGPMTAEELRTAIEKPAQQLGVSIEDGLTRRILGAVDQEPGYLPLLQFALTLLWARQQEGRLTHAAYDEMGGVEKALARYAEEVYEQLSPEEQKRTQRIFLQLVRPGEGTEDTRRVATRQEIGEDKWDLVTQLANARLVVTGRNEAAGDKAKGDKTGGEETVEIVHEALITGWDRLHQWLDVDRKFLIWHERLRIDVQQWEESNRDEGALLRGVPLTEADLWLQQRPDEISPSEQTLIQASLAVGEWERDVRERSRRWIRLGLVAGLVVVTALAAFIVVQSQAADNLKHIINAQTVANEAMGQDNNPQLGLLLALEAIAITTPTAKKPPIPQSVSALSKVVSRSDLLMALKDPKLGRQAHEDSVLSVEYSHNERWLLTASANDDKKVKIWDVPTGTLHVTLTYTGNRGLRSAAFSPDDEWVVAGSDDGTAIVWNVDTREQRILPVHLPVNDKIPVPVKVAYNPDGKNIITASTDNKIAVIWDTQTWLSHTLTASDQIRSVAYSPKGDIVVASKDGTVKIWYAAKGKQPTTWTDPDADNADLRTAMFSPDSEHIVTAIGQYAKIWDISGATPTLVKTLYGHTREVVYAAYSPKDYPYGSRIVTIGTDSRAVVWDANTGQPVFGVLAEPSNSVWSAALSRDGKRLITGHEWGNVKVWDAGERSDAAHFALVGHADTIESVVYERDDKRLVTVGNATYDGTAKVWDANTRQCLFTLSSKKGKIVSADYNSDGTNVVSASNDGTVEVWKAISETPEYTRTGRILQVGASSVKSAIFSPNDNSKILILSDGIVQVWDWNTITTTVSFSITGKVESALYSPDGKHIAITDDSNTPKVYTATNGAGRFDLIGHKKKIQSLVYSNDGKKIVTASDDGTARVWDANTGHEVAKLADTTGMIRAVFSPDGSQIVTVNEGGIASVWDVSSGVSLTLHGHQDKVLNAAYNPDGSQFVTVSADGSAKIWNTDTKQELFTLLPSNPVTKLVPPVVFSHDGKRIVIGSSDQTAVEYYTDWQELLTFANKRITSKLTDVEKELYLPPP